MYDGSATVQLAINTALDKATAHSECSLIVASVDAFQDQGPSSNVRSEFLE